MASQRYMRAAAVQSGDTVGNRVSSERTCHALTMDLRGSQTQHFGNVLLAFVATSGLMVRFAVSLSRSDTMSLTSTELD